MSSNRHRLSSRDQDAESGFGALRTPELNLELLD